MKNLFATLLGALGLLAIVSCEPALAANGWFSNPTCSGTALTSPTLAWKGELYYCADVNSAAATFFSPVARTSAAGYFTINRIGDGTQSGAGACEFDVYEATSAAGTQPANITGLSPMNPDSTGDTVQDAVSQNGGANRRHLHGVRAVGVVLRFTVKAAGTEQCVVALLGGF